MGESLPVLRTNRGDLRADFGGTHVDDLQSTAQHSPLLKLDHKLERIADLHEQAAFNPDAYLAHIKNLTCRRESAALQTATPTDLDA
jgi:hypothetical protein